ncbi:Type I phosphodiesterase / nucleotide pyrophosphatase family protein [Acanthocheilonema viteae]
MARIKLQEQNNAAQSFDQSDFGVCKKKFDIPPLLIISSDGFRNSYLDKNITPTIQRLIKYGTHSKYMLPTFPSKTFPNHYTMATGLYPPWHGIVDNHFYDAQFKDFFRKSASEPGWYLGEPIWKTVQKTGLKSAVFFWPGSEGIGKLPNYWMKYNRSIALTQRIDTLIEWLTLPDDERPSLIQAYFEEPDQAGHEGGPDSHMVRTAMILMDGMINYLINRLTEKGLMGCINFILLSDHDSDNVINDIISRMQCQHGNNYLVYRKDLVPIRFHYGASSSRIGDIIIKGLPGVCIFQTDEERESYKLFGDHGYDNRIESMRTIFIAVGPDIAQNREISKFQNIELYNLFAYLLRTDAAPNNGTNGTLFTVLRNPPPYPITITDRPSEQCTDKINMKIFFSRNCTLMDDMYQNCPMTLRSSVNANYDFSGELCSLQLCDAIIYFDKKLQKTIMVEGIFRHDLWMEEINGNCVTYVDNITRTNSYETSRNESYSLISLFGNLDRYYTLDLAQVMVPKAFADGIWQYVLNETAEYLVKYGNLRFFSGAIYDQDGDGIRDTDDIIRKSDPSHLFFVLMWCENNALISYTSCKDTVFVPYILPFNSNNLNCLKPSEYLYDNTARMRDIELLTGMEFFTDRNIWSDVEAIQLRTLLPDRKRSSS